MILEELSMPPLCWPWVSLQVRLCQVPPAQSFFPRMGPAATISKAWASWHLQDHALTEIQETVQCHLAPTCGDTSCCSGLGAQGQEEAAGEAPRGRRSDLDSRRPRGLA